MKAMKLNIEVTVRKNAEDTSRSYMYRLSNI